MNDPDLTRMDDSQDSPSLISSMQSSAKDESDVIITTTSQDSQAPMPILNSPANNESDVIITNTSQDSLEPKSTVDHPVNNESDVIITTASQDSVVATSPINGPANDESDLIITNSSQDSLEPKSNVDHPVNNEPDVNGKDTSQDSLAIVSNVHRPTRVEHNSDSQQGSQDSSLPASSMQSTADSVNNLKRNGEETEDPRVAKRPKLDDPSLEKVNDVLSPEATQDCKTDKDGGSNVSSPKSECLSELSIRQRPINLKKRPRSESPVSSEYTPPVSHAATECSTPDDVEGMTPAEDSIIMDIFPTNPEFTVDTDSDTDIESLFERESSSDKGDMKPPARPLPETEPRPCWERGARPVLIPCRNGNQNHTIYFHQVVRDEFRSEDPETNKYLPRYSHATWSAVTNANVAVHISNPVHRYHHIWADLPRKCNELAETTHEIISIANPVDPLKPCAIAGRAPAPPPPEFKTAVSEKWRAPYKEIRIKQDRYQKYGKLFLPINHALWNKQARKNMEALLLKAPQKRKEITKYCVDMVAARRLWNKQQEQKRKKLHEKALRECEEQDRYEVEAAMRLEDREVPVAPEPLWMYKFPTQVQFLQNG
ncbi:hypothetical protein EDC01DRAFT_634100 [Geopyxis carbonaria]|nr:hypothetical protein EDC01DRAFT_634100 [Geopyxis carbonaria]